MEVVVDVVLVEETGTKVVLGIVEVDVVLELLLVVVVVVLVPPVLRLEISIPDSLALLLLALRFKSSWPSTTSTVNDAV